VDEDFAHERVVDLVALIAEHMDTPGGQILTGDQDADPEFTSFA
jgi:hypothetical protein